jgi:hypothetical protein
MHLSETFFPGDVLMDVLQQPGEVIRTLSPVERGMFQDMGWTLAPEPRAPGFLVIGVLAVVARRRSSAARAVRPDRGAPGQPDLPRSLLALSPETVRISPVIHADARDRKIATGLRSEGWPGRFSRGVAARR